MTTAAGFWSDLAPSWRRCLELAWESFTEGSIPVGSVVTNGSETIVAAGRNRAFGRRSAGNGISGSHVAHAELNVLAALPPGEYPDHVLWSSLEPSSCAARRPLTATSARCASPPRIR